MSIRRPDGDRPTAPSTDDIKRRAALAAIDHAADATEARTFLEALDLIDYARAVQPRKPDTRLATKSRKTGTDADAAS